MRALRPLLALWLAMIWVPGLGELAQDAAHFALEADGCEDACPDDACPEQGCSPTSHHCSCCASTAAAHPSLVDASVAPPDRSEPLAWPLEQRGAAGVTRALLRPPTA